MNLPPLSAGSPPGGMKIEHLDPSVAGAGVAGIKPEPPTRAESTRLSESPLHRNSATAAAMGRNTLQNPGRKRNPAGNKHDYNSLQRHSTGLQDYDNVESCGGGGVMAPLVTGEGTNGGGVRQRSRTMGNDGKATCDEKIVLGKCRP